VVALTKKIIKQQVRQGSVKLREHDPGWYIRLSHIEFYGNDCMLTQLFGTFIAGFEEVFDSTHMAIYHNPHLLWEYGMYPDYEDEVSTREEWEKTIARIKNTT
jgi:hypothetical protein